MVTEPASQPTNGSDPFAVGVDALRLDTLTDPGPTAEAPTPVIDLRDGATTRVRVERDDNPFGTLSKQERMRLIVRVLCEIVAYGELDEQAADASTADGPTTPDLITPDHPAVNG
jgi:hypothetical protein